jgi:hypothetical protein
MKYTQKSFTVAPTPQYRANYDDVFRSPERKPKRRIQESPDRIRIERPSSCGCDDRQCPRCRAEDNE